MLKKTPENLEVSRKVSIFADDMKREEVISSIKALALKTLPPSSTLLLYGSRARGDNHNGSDWDLLILLDKASLSFNDYSVGYPFRELGWEINEEINPQVYSKKEWKDYEFSPFHKNVEHDKIVLL
jgi:predicted nucleotidyltransferase